MDRVIYDHVIAQQTISLRFPPEVVDGTKKAYTKELGPNLKKGVTFAIYFQKSCMWHYNTDSQTRLFQSDLKWLTVSVSLIEIPYIDERGKGGRSSKCLAS